MRVLMVSTYPPAPDGIATYAMQEVIRLRRGGDTVEVLSPSPSAAHYHLDFRSWRAFPSLARRLRRYERAIVQYHPEYFYASSDPKQRLQTNVGLAAAFRYGGNVELRVHEWDDGPLQANSLHDRAIRSLFLSARRVEFHTESQREEFCRQFRIPVDRAVVRPHGAHFVRRTSLTREQARARLGIPQSAFAFLCIGFIQRHKGFDRAIRAFAGLGPTNCRLDIVGSIRVQAPDVLAYLDDLRREATAVPGVNLHEGYVSDELFDTWIVACDVVVLPYRQIWTSGVLERAAILGRTILCTRVGGLAEQAPAGTVLVDDDLGLARAFRDLAGRDTVPFSGCQLFDHAARWSVDGSFTRADVQALVRQRAAEARGLDRAASAPERATPICRVEPLPVPRPDHARREIRLAKRIVRRATAWQIDPIVERFNQLREAVIRVVEGDDWSASSAGNRP